MPGRDLIQLAAELTRTPLNQRLRRRMRESLWRKCDENCSVSYPVVEQSSFLPLILKTFGCLNVF